MNATHPEIPKLTFEKVGPDGLVIMLYKTNKLYRLEAKAGQPLHFSNFDGVEVSDLRIKSASFQKQEVHLEHVIKWTGKVW
jgi:hypothetical protein